MHIFEANLCKLL